jgi:hypothetical protein
MKISFTPEEQQFFQQRTALIDSIQKAIQESMYLVVMQHKENPEQTWKFLPNCSGLETVEQVRPYDKKYESKRSASTGEPV